AAPASSCARRASFDASPRDTTPRARAHASRSPYVCRCSSGSSPRFPTVFVKSIAGCPPQKSNLYAGSERSTAPAERVTIKIYLTGYHRRDVTFKMYLGGYSVTLFSYAAIYLIWGSTFLAIRLAVDSIPPLLMMGVRCVAAGALLLARTGTPTFARIPAAVVILGEVAWAAGALYARRLPQTLALNAGMPLLTGGVFLIAASYAAREFRQFDPHAVSVVSAAALVYLIVFGSIVAFSAYAWLMQVA